MWGDCDRVQSLSFTCLEATPEVPWSFVKRGVESLQVAYGAPTDQWTPLKQKQATEKGCQCHYFQLDWTHTGLHHWLNTGIQVSSEMVKKTLAFSAIKLSIQ